MYSTRPEKSGGQEVSDIEFLKAEKMVKVHFESNRDFALTETADGTYSISGGVDDSTLKRFQYASQILRSSGWDHVQIELVAGDDRVNSYLLSANCDKSENKISQSANRTVGLIETQAFNRNLLQEGRITFFDAAFLWTL